MPAPPYRTPLETWNACAARTNRVQRTQEAQSAVPSCFFSSRVNGNGNGVVNAQHEASSPQPAAVQKVEERLDDASNEVPLSKENKYDDDDDDNDHDDCDDCDEEEKKPPYHPISKLLEGSVPDQPVEGARPQPPVGYGRPSVTTTAQRAATMAATPHPGYWTQRANMPSHTHTPTGPRGAMV
jgi:hypothetical protein